MILEMSFSLVRKRKSFLKAHIDEPRDDTWAPKKRALCANDNGNRKMDLRRGILERRLKQGKRLGKMQGVEK